MALPTSEDLGFCSSEDYIENEIHSPTDSSEDSVEVRVIPISIVNKRKTLETGKASFIFNGPLKKRMCLKIKPESSESHPFRPWSPRSCKNIAKINGEISFPLSYQKQICQPTKLPSLKSYSGIPSPINFCQQTEPVALIKNHRDNNTTKIDIKCQDLRVPIHPQIQNLSTSETERIILKSNEVFPSLKPNVNSVTTTFDRNFDYQRTEQRNYKNMTRERRIEANARERTRVHTISAAFDTLRGSIPSYSHNQKLSKLSVLRIACSYIMTLSSIVNNDTDNISPTLEFVDMVSRTIQREGKLRKKKDDND